MGSGPGLSDGDDTAWGPRPRMFPVWINVGAQFLGFNKNKTDQKWGYYGI